MTRELKACPFCGGEMLTGDAGFMHPEPNEDGQSPDCPLTGMSWRTSYYAAAWNTRTPDSVIAELVEAARETVIDLRILKSNTRKSERLDPKWQHYDNTVQQWIERLEAPLAKLEAGK